MYTKEKDTQIYYTTNSYQFINIIFYQYVFIIPLQRLALLELFTDRTLDSEKKEHYRPIIGKVRSLGCAIKIN